MKQLYTSAVSSLWVMLCWLLVIGVGVAWAVECMYSPGQSVEDPYTGQTYTLNQVMPQGFTLSGQGLSVTDPSQCRMKSANGDVWFMVSGSVCLVQTVISRAMFHVYCGVLLEFKPLIVKLLTLYIMLYATTILFGINNVNGREVMVRAVKIGVVIAFMTNADYMYFYLYEFFLQLIDEFSNILLSFEPLYDAGGNIAMSLQYPDIFATTPEEIVWAENGGRCIGGVDDTFPLAENAYPTVDCRCITNVPDWELCKVDTPPPFCAETPRDLQENCLGPGAPESYCTGAFEVSNCRQPASPTDVYGEPIWYIDQGGYLEYYTDENGARRRYYNGGVFSRIDVIFNAIVGSSEEGSVILLLAIAAAYVTNGFGWVLVFLTMMGIVAAFAAFARVMVTYLTAVMAVTFLLMFTPIFFAFFLFNQTSTFFMRWMQNIISYALQPILILGFLFGVSELVSVQGLWNKVGDAVSIPIAGDNVGHAIPKIDHSAGWEGFWKFQASGPGFVEFKCNCTDSQGAAIAAHQCVKETDGDGNVTYSGVGIENQILYEGSCSEPVCNATNPQGEAACVARNTMDVDILLPITAILVAWLMISAIVGGFMHHVPKMAPLLTKGLGVSSSSTRIGSSAKDSNIGMSGDRYDQGASQVYSIETPFNAAAMRARNKLGEWGLVGRNTPAAKDIAQSGGTVKDTSDVSKNEAGQAQSEAAKALVQKQEKIASTVRAEYPSSKYDEGVVNQAINDELKKSSATVESVRAAVRKALKL